MILSTWKKAGELDSLEQVEFVMALAEAIDRGTPVDLREQASVSESIPIEDGMLLLKFGFGVYLCEYDGPRGLKVMVKIESEEKIDGPNN